jgi:HK97 family phage major capsid protein
MPTTQQLRESRAKAIADARSLIDAADKEKRSLTTEERKRYDEFIAESHRHKDALETQEADRERRARLEEEERALSATPGRTTGTDQPGDGGQRSARELNTDAGRSTGRDPRLERRRSPIVIEKRGNRNSLRIAPGTDAHRRCQPEYEDSYRNWLCTGERRAPEIKDYESRALQTDLDTAGGFLTLPETLVAEIIKNVDDAVYLRGKARKFTITSQTLGVRKRTAKMAAFNWGGELATPTQDTALKFGKRTLTPHYMTGEILVSNDLLRAAVMDPMEIINYEMARDAGELEEKAFMTGSGAEQPLGVFTASADGISTARDFSTGNTTTAITADNLRTVKYSLKQQYRSGAEWMFHRDAVAMISKLKDGDGQYLWRPGITDGDPDKLLNLPFTETEWAPNTFTTGLYVGILANWNWYWICDGLDLGMQRLVEKYAEQNQVAFLVRRKTDAMPVLEEAFSRVKLG